MTSKSIVDDKRFLKKLVQMLQKLDKRSESSCNCIFENHCLNQFPGYDEVTVGFNHRWIIEKLIDRHDRTRHCLQVYPEQREELLYSCEEIEYTFSNDMDFNNDVHILCYLHIVRKNHGRIKDEAVNELSWMMSKKYELYLNEHAYLHPQLVTFSRIARCYPSITLVLNKNEFQEVKSIVCGQYPVLATLPDLIHFNEICFLLPELDNYPIAVLIALRLLYDSYYRVKQPLGTIYVSIMRDLKSKIYPEKVKYELCWKWGIIRLENGQLKFSLSFDFCREIAKDIIYDMRFDDSDLQYVLSLI